MDRRVRSRGVPATAMVGGVLRRSGVVLLGLLPSWLVAGCATAPSPRRGPAGRGAPTVGALAVEAQPSTAEVVVDGGFAAFAARTTTHPLELAPGLYRVEIRHRGYYSAYVEVTLRAAVRSQLTVRLRPVIDQLP